MKQNRFLNVAGMFALSVASVSSAMAVAAPAPPPAAPIVATADPAVVQQLIDALLAALGRVPNDGTLQDREAAIAFTLTAYPKNVAAVAIRNLLARANLPRKYRAALADYVSIAANGLNTFAGLTDNEQAFLTAGPSINGGATGVTYAQ